MPTAPPTVSVVLPTYNRADVVSDSIRSVLGQSFEDFELIVVDDASTDDTEDVVEGFDDDRIRYLAHETNRGAPAARNTGISAAEGEYIAFQDSDDRWLFDKLEKQMEAFRHAPPEIGVVYTGMVRVEGGTWKYLPYPGVEHTDGDIRRSLARQNFISTPVAMVRRECFERVGNFDEDVWPLSDWELWIRISDQFRFEFVDGVMVTGEVRSDSISMDQAALVRARRRILEKHEEFFDASSFASHLFYVGHGSMKLAESRKGRNYLVRAVKTNPRPVYVVALILSVLSPGVYSTVYQMYKGGDGRR